MGYGRGGRSVARGKQGARRLFLGRGGLDANPYRQKLRVSE